MFEKVMKMIEAEERPYKKILPMLAAPLGISGVEWKVYPVGREDYVEGIKDLLRFVEEAEERIADWQRQTKEALACYDTLAKDVEEASRIVSGMDPCADCTDEINRLKEILS